MAVDCPAAASCRTAGISWERSPIGRAFSQDWNGADRALLPIP
jgi:hypothetical protein